MAELEKNSKDYALQADLQSTQDDVAELKHSGEQMVKAHKDFKQWTINEFAKLGASLEKFAK